MPKSLVVEFGCEFSEGNYIIRAESYEMELVSIQKDEEIRVLFSAYDIDKLRQLMSLRFDTKPSSADLLREEIT